MIAFDYITFKNTSFERLFKAHNNISKFLKIVFNYFSSIILVVLIWNILIGLFIYNKTSSNSDNLGYGRKPNSTFVSGLEGYANINLIILDITIIKYQKK